MRWTPHQDAALLAIKKWLRDRNGPQIFRLFGFAGTGKTTIAKEVAGMVKDCRYAAFTGKAALVMQGKGCHGASTIHRLIYRPKEDDETGETYFRLNPASEAKDADVICVDEVSMVGEGLALDLLSFDTKVLVIGDPAQLPPVEGAGYFTDAEPDAMLTEIHRQAVDNPIIALATKVRQGEALKHGTYGESRVIPRQELLADIVMSADQFLVGMNSTRRSANRRIRKLMKFSDDLPMVGDKLVCLKNNHDIGVLNGSLWKVADLPENKNRRIVKMAVSPDSDDELAVEVAVPVDFFYGREDQLDRNFRRAYQEFDYGYALTCHKAQGSQWGSVAIADESGVFREHAGRWLYTAITRAAERVVIGRE